MITKENSLIMIDYAIKAGYKLNDWEKVFVKNISMMKPCRALSLKQEAAVRRIYDRAVGGGDREFHEYIK